MRTVVENKKGGVVTNTVFGVGLLVISVIVILVITSTLRTADLIADESLTTVFNGQNTTTMNATGSSFGNNTLGNSRSCAINSVKNSSTLMENINAGNYTVTAGTCTIAVADINGDNIFNNSIWFVNSTTTYLQDTDEEDSINYMSQNYTQGIDNISEKIPTILLIIAVVFLFGALVLLLKQANIMGIGGSGSSL